MSLLPFVCKWLGTHSAPKRFETVEKLRNHIVQHDISSCKIPGDPNYTCPWKGCNKYQSSIIKLEGIKICQVLFSFAYSVNSVEIIIIIVFCRAFTSTHPTKTIQGN